MKFGPVTKGEILFSTLEHFEKHFVRPFPPVAKLFPSKIDEYQRENPVCSSHVKDSENVFTALVNGVNL